MTDNVHITIMDGTKVVHEHSGHNVWTRAGKAYLTQIMAYQDYNLDSVYTNHRVKYIGIGIGGRYQATANITPALNTYYPVGSVTTAGFSASWGRYTDETVFATSGRANTYNEQEPLRPLIDRLERPVALEIGGPLIAYPGTSGQNYGKKARVFFEGPYVTEFSLQETVGGSFITFGVFDSVPISEIALMLSSAPVEQPFATGHTVAYHAFNPIPVTAGMTVLISWKVRI